jgi:hypothetical protein
MRKKNENVEMKKSNQDHFQNILSTLKGIKKTIAKFQKHATDTPVKIELVSQKKNEKWKLVLYGVILLIVLLLACIWWFIIDDQEIAPIQSKLFPWWFIKYPLKGSIVYPANISLDEEQSIELTLINYSNTPVLGIKSFLIYPEDAAITITSNKGSSIMDFGILEANETKTQKIKFFLKKSTGKCEMELKLRITSQTVTAPEIENPYPIGIITIPHIKDFIRLLFTFLLSSILIPFIRKRIE